MEEQTVEKQIRIYLYDLMNTAREHGFKADETWEINLVGDEERADIQRQYYPIIISRMVPENVLQVFHQVKSRLSLPLNKAEQLLDTQAVLKNDIRYLVAYSLKRQRN